MRTLNSDNEQSDTGSVYNKIVELILPQNLQMSEQECANVDQYLKIAFHVRCKNVQNHVRCVSKN
jgi:hypothetical protein